jgi:hypothetical protein
MPSEVVWNHPAVGNAHRRQRGSRYVADVTQATPSGRRARVTVTTSRDVELEV